MLALFFWYLVLFSFLITIICFFGMWFSTVQREEIFMIFCEIGSFSCAFAMLSFAICVIVGLLS